MSTRLIFVRLVMSKKLHNIISQIQNGSFMLLYNNYKYDVIGSPKTIQFAQIEELYNVHTCTLWVSQYSS